MIWQNITAGTFYEDHHSNFDPENNQFEKWR
jgi:hypothetical protein